MLTFRAFCVESKNPVGVSIVHHPHYGTFSATGHHTHHRVFQKHPDLAEPTYHPDKPPTHLAHKVYAKYNRPEKQVHVFHHYAVTGGAPVSDSVRQEIEDHLRTKHRLPKSYKISHEFVQPKTAWYLVG